MSVSFMRHERSSVNGEASKMQADPTAGNYPRELGSENATNLDKQPGDVALADMAQQEK
jgi:hypothetical protein